MMKPLSRHVLAVTMVAAAALPAWSAGPSIAFTLNGKAVSSIPVDQLGALTVTVNAGKPFKSVFAGQWGGIGQALSLRGKIINQGAGMPDLSTSHTWGHTELAATALDSGWSARPTASRSMYDVATRMSLHNADSTQQVAFTARFMRLSYTGKTIWQNGGWVKETVWETLGTPVGSATLKLEPPRSAGSLPTAAILSKAAGHTEKARMAVQTLLKLSNSEANFDGTAIRSVVARPGAPVRFNWNYDGDTQLVYAKIPVTVTLHAEASNIQGGMPGAGITADFVSPMVVSAKQTSGGAWTFEDLEFGSTLRDESRTTDGRSPDQVTASVDPGNLLKADPNKSKEEQALDLIKSLGF
jgi:hypothetical protein